MKNRNNIENVKVKIRQIASLCLKIIYLSFINPKALPFHYIYHYQVCIIIIFLENKIIINIYNLTNL